MDDEWALDWDEAFEDRDCQWRYDVSGYGECRARGGYFRVISPNDRLWATAAALQATRAENLTEFGGFARVSIPRGERGRAA
jgi:hypothetical protein